MSDRESGDEQQQQYAARGTVEQEIATKTLHIQSKRFYLDVKQNRRGRFLKIAEVIAGGKKSRLVMTMSTGAEFRDHLTDMSEFYASLGPSSPDNAPEDGRLKSEQITRDQERRYYLDLRENARGRFLKVTQSSPYRPRCSIALPAQGMIEFRDALTDLLDEYGTEEQENPVDLPDSKSMRTENKKFYFDCGQNSRGVFLRISEVRSNFRTAITIPEKAWPRFRDIVSEFVDSDLGGAEVASDQASGTKEDVEGDIEVEGEGEGEVEGEGEGEVEAVGGATAEAGAGAARPGTASN